MYLIKTNSEKETIELGKKIAEKLEKGKVIVLTGDLGAGKTKLTEGILSFFDLQDEISSPTFTIVNEYHSNKGLNIYHFDVYRLSDSDEFFAIGGEEYFEKGACIIEWGEMLQDILPNDYIHITFEKDENNIDFRNIKIDVIGNVDFNLEI